MSFTESASIKAILAALSLSQDEAARLIQAPPRRVARPVNVAEPDIVTLDLSARKVIHQRWNGDFANGGDKPYHRFAYFSVDEPYYGDTPDINTYVYRSVGPINRVVKVTGPPEDLYAWVEKQVGREIPDDIYVLNDVLVGEMGYNGWFRHEYEYVFSKHVIDTGLELERKVVRNATRPAVEEHGTYFM